MTTEATAKRTGKQTAGLLKRFVAYYRPHKKLFSMDMTAALLVAAIGVVYPIITRTMLNTLIPERNYRMIVVFGMTLLALYIVKMLLKPTSTAFVGELAAFVISTTYCVTAAIIYQLNRTKKGAILAMVIATLCMAFIGSFANYAFIIPFYVNWYHIPLETIVAMGNAIFPVIHDKLSFVLCCVLPFNLIKALIVDVVTYVIYKHVSPLLKQ